MDNKVYIFYDPNGQIYAHSMNKEIVTIFEGQRALRGFLKKKVYMTDTQLKSFSYLYSHNQLFMNVLTDGKTSFDFVTTYAEDSRLSRACEQIMDQLISLETTLLQIPFDRSGREVIGNMIAFRKEKEGKMGKFNTFQIFMDLFKESIL